MFKIGEKLSKIFTRYYKVTSYHNPKPNCYLKVELFGRIKIIPKHGHSRLEEATKEELCECLENAKKIKECSEKRENLARNGY